MHINRVLIARICLSKEWKLEAEYEYNNNKSFETFRLANIYLQIRRLLADTNYFCKVNIFCFFHPKVSLGSLKVNCANFHASVIV